MRSTLPTPSMEAPARPRARSAARMMCISCGLCTEQVARGKVPGETPAFFRHTPMRIAHWLPNTGKPCGMCVPSMLVRPCGATQGYCVELLAGWRYQRSLKATIDVSWGVARGGSPWRHYHASLAHHKYRSAAAGVPDRYIERRCAALRI